MKIFLTNLTLPDGHVLTFDPPIEFVEGEGLPMQLSMGKHIVTHVIEMQWCEVDDDYDA